MAELIDARVFSDLVSRIYDCAIDPAGWSGTLEVVTAELEFANASLSLMSLPSGRFTINETCGISDYWKSRMGEFSQDIVDLWGGPERMWSYPFDRPTMLSRANPTAFESSNRYLREWRDPQGLLDVTVSILVHHSDCIANLGMGRHREQGPITETDLDRVSLFLPHYRRAVKIGWLLDGHASASGSFGQVVEGMATPVVLVGAELDILHANRAAVALLDDGALLARSNGRLEVQPAAAQKVVREAVAQAARSESSMRGGSIGIGRADDAIGVRSVQVLPLRNGHHRAKLFGGAVAAILVSTPRLVHARLGEEMTTLFGLTRAEAAVFERIAAGQSTRQAASALGVADSTVRTHLLRIFEKTDVHRQSQLVQLASALVPPVVH